MIQSRRELIKQRLGFRCKHLRRFPPPVRGWIPTPIEAGLDTHSGPRTGRRTQCSRRRRRSRVDRIAAG